MKRITTLLIALLSLIILPVHAQSEDDFVRVDGANLIYRGQPIILKGVNFDNLPALGAEIGEDSGNFVGPGDMAEINIGEEDYVLLSELGANTVRLGLDFVWYNQDRDQFYSIIDQHVTWAGENNLWVVFNLFSTPGNCYEGYSEHCGIWESEEEQQQLIDFWVDMATRYRDNPTVAGYGLLNEPTPPGPGWSSTWFDLAQEIRDAVAEVDSNHLVFINAGSDSIFTRIFEGDNVVYEVHDYLPGVLALASEDTEYVYPGPAPDYDDREIFWSKATFAGEGDVDASLGVRASIYWAQDNNVPLFIGEWGTRAAYEGYDQFLIDKAELYNEWGINHTVYTWRHDPEFWKWGAFPMFGELEVTDQAKLDAYLVSWEGAIQPNTEMPDGVATEEPTEEVCTVTSSSNINRRAGAGTDFDISGVLQAGEAVTVIGQTTAADGFVWWQLDGGLGWVRSDLVSNSCGA